MTMMTMMLEMMMMEVNLKQKNAYSQNQKEKIEISRRDNAERRLGEFNIHGIG